MVRSFLTSDGIFRGQGTSEERKAMTRGPYCGHQDRAEPLVNPIREDRAFSLQGERQEFSHAYQEIRCTRHVCQEDADW